MSLSELVVGLVAVTNAGAPEGTPAAPEDAPDVFFHIHPSSNKKIPYSEADNELIRQAKARGSDSVRISDVPVGDRGKVLQFEVRLKAPFGRLVASPASGMAQVNIGNQNTRVVVAEKSKCKEAGRWEWKSYANSSCLGQIIRD